MRIFLFLIISIIVSLKIQAQGTITFGNLSSEELTYTPDESVDNSPAIVLFEKGDNYFEVSGNRIWLVKKYHSRLKILSADGFKEGTISIPYFHSDGRSEEVEKIKAVTHQENTKVFLNSSHIYTKDINDRWSEISFSFPDIRVGSILEYKYTLRSPFIYNLNGWSFQSHLPKLYSEFNATIPANYRYNRTLVGSLPLATNEASLKTNCFKIDGYKDIADCEILQYAMKDIPAFKEEAYMLAPSNYMSKIEFELSEHHLLDGRIQKYTSSWDKVDREIAQDVNLGRQLRKENYLSKQVPQSLLGQGKPLEKAKNIYNYVQRHFSWDGTYKLFNNQGVKRAYDSGKGSAVVINLALVNLLNAAGITTELVLLSTRENGLPKKTHPVISDFNYAIALAEIGGEKIFLDASEDQIPFGVLPTRCLNYYGRVMDLENGSYWQTIEPTKQNKYTIRSRLVYNAASNRFEGVMNKISTGQKALERLNTLSFLEDEKIMVHLEREMGQDYIVTDYTNNSASVDKGVLSERFEFEFEKSTENDLLSIKPIIVPFFKENPFTAEQRSYPVDFGYPAKYSFHLSLELPDGYSVVNLPEPRAWSLPTNEGEVSLVSKINGNNLSVLFNLNFNESHYRSEVYPVFREFFEKVMDIQEKSVIILKKV